MCRTCDAQPCDRAVGDVAVRLTANDRMASDSHNSVADVVPRHLQTSIDISAVLSAGVADIVASTTLGNDPVFVVLRP